MDLKDQDEFLKTIENIARSIIKKEFKNNYYVNGVITKKNDNGTYDVRIDGTTSALKTLRNETFEVGDVVFVLVKNGEYSFKYIDCKRP